MKKEKKEKKEKTLKLGIKTIDLKSIIFPIKLISIVGVVLGFIFLILTGYYCVVSTNYILNSSPEEIQNDKLTVNYISNINDYSIEETKEIIGEIGEIGSKTEFLMFEVILPTIAIVLVTILIVILCKKSYDIVKNVKSNKDLFTEKNLKSLKDISSLVLDMYLIFFLIYGIRYIFYLIFIDLVFQIILYLFNNCVEKEK